MWTRENLQDLIRGKLSDYALITVSNRQPVVHSFRNGKPKSSRGSGGVISALTPVMQTCNGLWVAWGNGDADRQVSDADGKITVEEDGGSFTLKRIFLSKEEKIGYYYGYSNEAIWPICHTVFNRPTFRREDWDIYKQVNARFADAIIKELAGRKAFIWIQDYHLCLLPQMLKEKLGNNVITAHFWHIPWPGYETFRICPQKQEILNGLLANDLLGFHIRYHCHNFIDCVDRELESKIDRERFSVTMQGKETLIRAYPISVDYQYIEQKASGAQIEGMTAALREEFGLSGYKILLGLDRIDYTKGIPERLLAFDRLLEKHPEWKEKAVFLQMGELSRLHIPKYKQLNDELNALVEQINWKHGTDTWKPIVLIRRHVDFPEPLAYYRLADALIVSSLHDGMNLVAKEFIAAQKPDKGMLILSRFTGAARELSDALLFNPFDREELADAMHAALGMSREEIARRTGRMKSVVSANNIYRWAGKIISDLLNIEFRE